MKYFILFTLLTLQIVNSQEKPNDLTELTVYHYYSPLQIAYQCDGIREIEIEEFADHVSWTDYIKYNSSNEKTVKKLYSIIRNAKKWKRKELNVFSSFLSNGYIENRFIIRFNSFCDTIYTTKGNKNLIYKEGKYEYLAENDEIINSFDNDLKRFFEVDYIKKRDKIESIKNDSIDVNEIEINDKKIFKISRKQFENEVSKFTNIVTDTLNLFFLDQNEIDISKQYLIIDSHINFYENQLSYFSIKNELNKPLLKVKLKNIEFNIGDNLEKIKTYFENSTIKATELKKLYNCSIFEELSVEINFKDKKGNLYLNFHDDKLYEITCNFE